MHFNTIKRCLQYGLSAATILAGITQVATADTQTILFQPFAEKQTQLAKASGECWTSSSATSRADAWRCRAGNTIYDPCFVNHFVDKNKVLCARSPWDNALTELTLTKPLPIPTNPKLDISKAQPWVIQLANGQRCTFMTGATRSTQGMRVNYGCIGGGFLVGDPLRCKTTWEMNYAQSIDPSKLNRVKIAKAWF